MLGKPTMIFVDAQNLFHAARSYEDEFQVDAAALLKELSSGYDLIRAYWFDSFPTDEQRERINSDDTDSRQLSDKSNFFHFLEMNGYRVEAKPLRMRDGDFVEKGADIRLATEMIAQGFNDSYDVGIVVTGDADFIKSIEYVQDQGKIVKVASFEGPASGDLKRTADKFVSLDNIAEDIRR